MEVVNELRDLYKKALSSIPQGEITKWEKSNHIFTNDPPCIKALLEHGVFELGSINSAQFKLAAYFKITDKTIPQVTQILDEWVRIINPKYIYEHRLDGSVDFSILEAQNRYIVRTIFASSEYGFSCAGIKQIPGVTEYCTNECRQNVIDEITVSLFDATRAEYRHKRIVVNAECIGRRDAVFVIPKIITALCTGKQTIGSTKCVGCPLYNSNDSPIQFEVNAASKRILTFIEPSRTTISGKVGALIGLARGECSNWKWSMTEQNAETIFIVPPITNEYSSSMRHTRQEAYFIGHGTQTNQAYLFSGYVHVNENNNIAKLVFDSHIETEDSLTEFERTPKMVAESKLFEVGTLSPIQKYEEIIESLVYNHIKIWGREAMIMAMDLAYHSVRRILFQKSIIKGWLNLLIIGDSGQAKSTVAERLMQHYGLGYKASAEACTRAGLLYGVEVKNNAPNCLIWGAIPRHSGRLVFIDELKSLILKGHFAELTDVRSAGVVDVDTIVSGRAMAETRLIMLTNPLAKRLMGSYMYPVEAITDLIPDLEDTRRFDIVVGAASQEISDELIHQNIYDIVAVNNIYTADICKNHLLWIWNLSVDDIVISKNVEITTLDLSLQMCKMYSPMIPLVEPADQREKLIRVATAFAARLNAVANNGKLYIEEDHIRAAFEFINTIYSSDALQYDIYSQVNARLKLGDALMEKLETELKNSEWAPYWKEIVWYIVEENWLEAKICAVVVGCNVSIVVKLFNWCVAYKLCKVIKGSYVKTPNGVTFFRKVIDKELEAQSGETVKKEKLSEDDDLDDF